jgi:putative ABC transport system substrate-binding protein
MTRMRDVASRVVSRKSANGFSDDCGGENSKSRPTRRTGTPLQFKMRSGTQKFVPFLLLGFLLQMMLASAFAQSSQPRIGVLLTGFPIRSPETEQFRQGLRGLGYTEGRDVIVDWRSAEGNYSHLPRLLAEIIDGKPDIIVVEGTAAALQVRQANLNIPVVMAVVSDPLASGLVESLARPGGVMTGLSMMTADITTKRLELLKECIPSLRRAGVLLDASLPWHESTLTVLDQAANQLGIRLSPVRVAGMDGIALAFAEHRRARVEAVYVLDSALLGRNVAKLLALARRARLPVIYGRREWVEGGALLSYSADFGDMFRRSAKYVDRILKGEKAADLPIEQPIKFELAINLNTAKVLKLRIPASIEERANEVIP